MQISGIQRGDNLYGWNKFKVAESLREALPYIGEVSIRRSLPSTVVITVTEWDAVAQIAPADPEQVAQAQTEQDDQEDEGQDTQAQEEGEPPEQKTEPSPAAQQPWLISVTGKLLEPAPPDSPTMMVTGVTALMPQAGASLVVPQSEQKKLEILLDLLLALDQADMIKDVSQLSLGNTQVELRYLDRFTVKLEMSSDFRYEFQVLKRVREQIDEKRGPDARGSMDLTQDGYEVVFSPERR